jgi:hypothetical protein
MNPFAMGRKQNSLRDGDGGIESHSFRPIFKSQPNMRVPRACYRF